MGRSFTGPVDSFMGAAHSFTSARRRANLGRNRSFPSSSLIRGGAQHGRLALCCWKLPRVLRTVLPSAVEDSLGACLSLNGQGPAWVPGEREGIVIHVVVLSGSVLPKKFVAVCLNEVLFAGQNAFGQRLDGGQFQRLLHTPRNPGCDR